ncbi:Calcium uptake protein 1, mitochondrial [Trichoplax sp. H2]|nr:Calcium uptake protein 1, mitochondrial [Trichoplax sp. H2]|eukprot:RDD36099.1 Calcium uptake protein 1, mitochondrial [Trichoplax sp. H2]
MLRKLFNHYRSTGRLLVTTSWRRYQHRISEEERLKIQRKNTRLISVMAGSATAVIGCSILLFRQMKNNKAIAEVMDKKLQSENLDEGTTSQDVDGTDTPDADDEKEEKFHRRTFRERKIIEYENRIRAYSTPDKIFRYFATIKAMDENGNYEIYMTPDDFVRSLRPNAMQPENLGLDKFLKYNPKKDPLPTSTQNEDDDSIFSLLGCHGLISFSDYIFLLTVLSTPRRNFEIAFKMFDIDGDGEIQQSEFDLVGSITLAQTPVGMRHRDRKVTGNVLSSKVNSALSTYFFGKDGKKKLTINQFLKFHGQLQRDLLKVEFDQQSPENGLISRMSFAKLLLVYGGFDEMKRRKFYRRLNAHDEEFPQYADHGITFKEYESYFDLLLSLDDLDTALSLYNAAGVSLSRERFKHVVKIVTDRTLEDHLIDIIFALFDADNDGELSYKEFVQVMKERQFRGLEKSKDTGVTRLLNALWTCTKSTITSGSES